VSSGGIGENSEEVGVLENRKFIVKLKPVSAVFL
jgi:hypothetical protein